MEGVMDADSDSENVDDIDSDNLLVGGDVKGVEEGD